MEILEFQRKLHVFDANTPRFPITLPKSQESISIQKKIPCAKVGILHNAKFVIYDKRATHGDLNLNADWRNEIANTPSYNRYPGTANEPWATDQNPYSVPDSLSRTTSISRYAKLSLRQLGISSGAVFQLYDERGQIKISVITPEHGELRLAVIEMVEIVELQTNRPARINTKIPIRDQMLSFITKSTWPLSRQTFPSTWASFSHAGVYPFSTSAPIFTIRLHIIYNGEIREYKLVPQQDNQTAYPGRSTNMACKAPLR